MKKILAMLLAVSFLMSVTVAAVSAAPGNGQWTGNNNDSHNGPGDNNNGNHVNPGDNNKDKDEKDKRDKERKDKEEKDKRDKERKDKDEKKIEKKVVKILKVVKKHNGIMKKELIKFTEKSHGHIKKVWFAIEWVFVPFHVEHHR